MTQFDALFRDDGPLARLLPAYLRRVEQVDLTNAIGELLATEGAAGLFEAGTGTGKTLAYLIPALHRATVERRVIISTHTIALQQQLAEKDIPIAKEIDGESGLIMTAKGRSNYLCLLALEGQRHSITGARDEGLAAVQSWAMTTTSGDRSDLPFSYGRWGTIAVSHETCLGRSCGFFDKCFYFSMRKKLEKASVILVNHALFFADLCLKMDTEKETDASVLPTYESVIFDEAHRIPEVAAEAFTNSVSLRGLYMLLNKVNGAPDSSLDTLKNSATAQRLGDEFFGAFRSAAEKEFLIVREAEGSYAEIEQAGLKLITQLHAMENQIQQLVDETGTPEDQWRKALVRLNRSYRKELADVILSPDENRVLWGERAEQLGAGSITLHRTPIRLGEILTRTLWNCTLPRNVALLSATLTTEADFSYIKATLGLNRSTRTVIESASDSPFDFRNQSLIYTPALLVKPEDTTAYRHALVDEIVKLITASGGGAFIMLTSHRALLDVYLQLLALELPFPLMRQGDAPAARLVQKFKEMENAVLIGTFSLWEGIDVQGPALRLVVIDRLPFTVPDHPVARARAAKCYEEGEDWFNEVVIPQAVIRLKQGVGRLIRSESDYGVIAILDSRITQSRYGEVFMASLPGAPSTSEMEVVQTFYGRFNKNARTCPAT